MFDDLHRGDKVERADIVTGKFACHIADIEPGSFGMDGGCGGIFGRSVHAGHLGAEAGQWFA